MDTLSCRFAAAEAELRAAGISLRIYPDGFAVYFRAGGTPPATAYFTEDFDDAIEHGRAMAASARAGSDQRAEGSAVTSHGRKRPRRVSRPRSRRRFVARHNRRLRARALRDHAAPTRSADE
jgi:hypothetical protein